MECWLNGRANKRASGGWLWYPQGRIASGIGTGPGIRFADMDGDGKADLVWIGNSGKLIIWLKKATIKSKIKIQVKWFKENRGNPVGLVIGAFRKDWQLADIDGNGRADYIWVHPEDGSVRVWINQVGEKQRNWVHYE